MKQLVEFPCEGGGSIVFEVDQPADHPLNDRIGLQDGLVYRSKETLESAISRIQPVANAIIAKVQTLNQPADSVEVRFGLKMSAEMGLVVASCNAEGNYEIVLKWDRGGTYASAP